MQFRNDRRRRVFTDELSTAGAEDTVAEQRPAEDAAAAKPGIAYSEAARRERQPRLTDLMPSRYLTLSLLLGASVLAIAMLLLAHHCHPLLATYVGPEAAAPFNLAARGSLGVWFSSLLLGTTGAVALLVYSLRRHRVDDYHGRYRVWLWGVLLAWLLSIDQVTSLHRLMYALAAPLATGSRIEPITLGRSLLVALLFACGLRLAIEMRRARAATVALGIAASLLTMKLAVRLHWIDVSVTMQAPAAAALAMLGHVALLASLMLYARYVILDVEGLLPVRVKRIKTPKPKAAKKAAKAARKSAVESAKPLVDPPQKSKPHVPVRSDLDSGADEFAAAKVTARPAAPTKTAAVAAVKPIAPVAASARPPAGASDNDDDSPLLSRAERKKQRRQMRRQQDDEE